MDRGRFGAVARTAPPRDQGFDARRRAAIAVGDRAGIGVRRRLGQTLVAVARGNERRLGRRLGHEEAPRQGLDIVELLYRGRDRIVVVGHHGSRIASPRPRTTPPITYAATERVPTWMSPLSVMPGTSRNPSGTSRSLSGS